jgi:hypothetical protein
LPLLPGEEGDFAFTTSFAQLSLAQKRVAFENLLLGQPFIERGKGALTFRLHGEPPSQRDRPAKLRLQTDAKRSRAARA